MEFKLSATCYHGKLVGMYKESAILQTFKKRLSLWEIMAICVQLNCQAISANAAPTNSCEIPVR